MQTTNRSLENHNLRLQASSLTEPLSHTLCPATPTGVRVSKNRSYPTCHSPERERPLICTYTRQAKERTRGGSRDLRSAELVPRLLQSEDETTTFRLER